MSNTLTKRTEITEQALPSLNRLIWTISIFLAIQPLLFLLINWRVLIIYSVFDNIAWVVLSYITVLPLFYSYNRWGAVHLFVTEKGFTVERGISKKVSHLNFDNNLSIQSNLNWGISPSLSIITADYRINIPLRILSYDKIVAYILPLFSEDGQVKFKKFIDDYYNIFDLQEEDNRVGSVIVHILFPVSIIFSYYIWGVSQFFTIFWATFSITVPLIWSSATAILYRINSNLPINISTYTIRFTTGFVALSTYLFYGYIFKIAFVYR